MGRMIRDTANRLPFVFMCAIVICLLLSLGGCSTASWIIHHGGTSDDLFVTEVDVDALIDDLSLEPEKYSGAVLYNASAEKYELTPDTYKRALRDGIIRRIQDKKIKEFLEDYRPETFMSSLRKDLGTAGILVILLGVLGSLFY
jgi:hypothetical protein